MQEIVENSKRKYIKSVTENGDNGRMKSITKKKETMNFHEVDTFI